MLPELVRRNTPAIEAKLPPIEVRVLEGDTYETYLSKGTDVTRPVLVLFMEPEGRSETCCR